MAIFNNYVKLPEGRECPMRKSSPKHGTCGTCDMDGGTAGPTAPGTEFPNSSRLKVWCQSQISHNLAFGNPPTPAGCWGSAPEKTAPETETDRQTDRHSETDAGRQTNRLAGRQARRQAGRQTARQAGREAGRQTDRQIDRQAGRQTDRQAGRQTAVR